MGGPHTVRVVPTPGFNKNILTVQIVGAIANCLIRSELCLTLPCLGELGRGAAGGNGGCAASGLKNHDATDAH